MKTLIQPEFLPPSRGIFSPAIKCDLGNTEMIFVAGQMAKENLDKPTAEQAEEIFNTIEKILMAAGASMNDVVKAQIFLTNIGDFASVSPIRDRYFANAKPVSTMVEVSAFARPGATIEIEVTAFKAK